MRKLLISIGIVLLGTILFVPPAQAQSYTADATVVDCDTINVVAAGPGQLTVSADIVLPVFEPLFAGAIGFDNFSMDVDVAPGPRQVTIRIYVDEAGLPPGIDVATVVIDLPPCVTTTTTTQPTTTTTTAPSTTTTQAPTTTTPPTTAAPTTQAPVTTAPPTVDPNVGSDFTVPNAVVTGEPATSSDGGWTTGLAALALLAAAGMILTVSRVRQAKE